MTKDLRVRAATTENAKLNESVSHCLGSRWTSSKATDKGRTYESRATSYSLGEVYVKVVLELSEHSIYNAVSVTFARPGFPLR